MSRTLKITSIIVYSIILVAGAVLFFGTRGMGEIRAYTIPDIDMNNIADGEYTGALTKTRWALSVSVRVKNYMIEDIIITDKKNSNITNDLINQLHKKLVNTRTPVFDAISRATMTSKGYLIAVSDALTK